MNAANIAITGALGVFVGLVVLSSPRCLVLSDPTFGTSCPPTIVAASVDPAPGPINYYSAQEDGGAPTLYLSFDVSTCNVTSNLIDRVFIDNNVSNYGTHPIDSNGNEVRHVTMQPVSLAGLAYGCHTILVLVSSEFSAGDPTQPATSGDLAELVWTVAYNPVGDAGSPSVLTVPCAVTPGT